jgi:hypothetical protein
MAVFIVSYDLLKSGQNYAGLIREIKAIGDCCKPLESTWLISTHQTADQISQRLLAKIDSNDNLLIIPVIAGYEGWLPQIYWDWLKQHGLQAA